ncbi:MAG: PCMD domain-containing protein, partial [Bacteroidales bacterium]|nr:PCMD domain-containing protein [Bacteroidales bacterium]
RGYSMTVVFSSSKGGDSFIGAVGSTLCIDKVRLICESEDN